MVKKIHINFTNKWFYTFVLIIGIFALGVGVWATSHPSPGHTAIELEGVCLSDGTNCLGGGGGSLWTASGSNIYYNTGNVGIGTTSPSKKLHVAGFGGGSSRAEIDLTNVVSFSNTPTNDYEVKLNFRHNLAAANIIESTATLLSGGSLDSALWLIAGGTNGQVIIGSDLRVDGVVDVSGIWPRISEANSPALAIAGNGVTDRQLGQHDLCFLSLCAVGDIDNGNSLASCSVFKSTSTNWVLRVSIVNDGDADVLANAYCVDF